jgi:hypothetical protein
MRRIKRQDCRFGRAFFVRPQGERHGWRETAYTAQEIKKILCAPVGRAPGVVRDSLHTQDICP